MNDTTDTKSHRLVAMDGCTAAAYVAYALSEVATVYPITPIASMGETASRWAMQGRTNFAGQPMCVKEMESEPGAPGATHGALAAGALATTFTSSQGLMLMIPNMYKISGEMLPGVFHVGTRSLATHALSIFGDHQDVMACRATGFAFLASASVQETHDLAIVAHLAAIEGSLPVCHFFDGWRTSNQIDTIDILPYERIYPLIDRDALARFRARALNPEHPVARGSAQNPDVYFQNREAPNRYYDAFPLIVQKYMDKVASLTGRRYSLFDYAGAPDAEDVVIVIGSAAEVCEQTLKVLDTRGYKGGVVKVRLYRPFSAEALLRAIPDTAVNICVLDRTKEPGAEGEPLFKDVATALMRHGRQVNLFGGRYGLSSKEFDPSMVKAIFDNMHAPSPKREFTVGINDDVTHLSLPCAPLAMPPVSSIVQARFYGFGSDGTVGATKQVASVLSSAFGFYSQAFFQYSAKKSGGYTISQLRLSHNPVKADYSIGQADYVACHKDTYVGLYDMVSTLAPGGVFVLNSPWGTLSRLEEHLPASMRKELATRKARLYNIDAAAIAASTGLGVRINMIMEAVFLYLMGDRLDSEKAIGALRDKIARTYMHEGQAVVDKNLAALDLTRRAIRQFEIPSSWAEEERGSVQTSPSVEYRPMNIDNFAANIGAVCNRLEGDSLPVSAFTPDGALPMGTTAYEKRRIALKVPVWEPDKCVECTLCSLVCPHAAIRLFLADDAQLSVAPRGFVTRPARGLADSDGKPLHWRIQVYTEDCTGCGSCAEVCPGHALTMTPAAEAMAPQLPLLEYCQEHIGYRPGLLPRFTVRGSQLFQPLMQFSGACGGCGETPYVKLLTQLFGERMIIANATGCSSVWGVDFPANAYCVNARGKGPAWANSLFEDNAEYGYGMAVAVAGRRAALADDVRTLATTVPALGEDAIRAMQAWLKDSSSEENGDAMLAALAPHREMPQVASILARADLLTPKSVWAVGGDGWAYDIGFAGLDHVLARRTDINMLVLDTECYSNTGGQMSKATPVSAVAAYAPDGKRTFKKDLGRMMMTYGNVYVASVALGANPAQTITALQEAEAYPGPSIVIAYCPCINHGLRAGMNTTVSEERDAVKSGYWPLYRYNPALAAQGKEPLIVDCAAPDGTLPAFLAGESRYQQLRESDPALADTLQGRLADRTAELHTLLMQESRLPASK